MTEILATDHRGHPSAVSLPELLRTHQPTVSFEFFPPKDQPGEQQLWEAIRRLEALHPHFVSVTYGAGGSKADRTVGITERICRETTLTPMAHLTCVNSTVASLRQVIGCYAEAGVRNVLALRGDPPRHLLPTQTVAEAEPPSPLAHAEDLVRLVRKLGTFSVGVAAFPDKHPESPSFDHDIAVLRAKQEAGAQFAITQFFFSAEAFLRLRERMAAAGVTMPLIAGIMPVTSVSQINRFAQLSATTLPTDLVQQLEAVAAEPAAVREVGVAYATQLCQRLLDEQVAGLHFYTLNRSRATYELAQHLGLGTPVTLGHPSSRAQGGDHWSGSG